MATVEKLREEMAQTLENIELDIKGESWRTCRGQLKGVERLLDSCIDGFKHIKAFTLGGSAEDKKLTVQLLYLCRSFSSLRSSYALVQTGYYSQAMILMRSALEDLLVCQKSKVDSALAQRLLEGREESFNFTRMADTEEKEFGNWWKGLYKNLSLFAHPRSPGLKILLSVEKNQPGFTAGPSFNQEYLLGAIYYQLIILTQTLGSLAPVINSRDTAQFASWKPGALKAIEEANKLIKKILEDLDPEGRLAMREALSAPKEESRSWEEYKQQRAARVRDKKS